MSTPMSTALLAAGLLLFGDGPVRTNGDNSFRVWTVAQQGGAHQPAPQPSASTDERSPEEKMRARFPQPIKVGDLIDLPVLDWKDRTLGHVRHVVRTPEGKIRLIVTYGDWFGWGGRLVAVPIEVVAILGRQLVALDWERKEFDAAPTWSTSSGQDAREIASGEAIRIAITRR